MNPKGNTRARYYETNKPRKDKFKGHKGKIRKQELFKSRLKSSQVIDSEITELQLRYAKVSFQPEGLQQKFEISTVQNTASFKNVKRYHNRNI